MILSKNISIDITEDLLDGIGQLLSDEVPKCGKRQCLHAIKKIPIQNIISAGFFHSPQRTDAMFHESKEYHFKELLFLTSWGPVLYPLSTKYLDRPM